MGVRITSVIEGESKYGTNAVEQLAAYLGKSWSPTKLYSYRDLASEYTKDRIAQLAKAKLADGGHVTVSHCLAIIKVKSKAERKKLWSRVFDEGLSSLSLQTEIAASLAEKKNNRGGGRKPSKPTSIMGGAQEIAKMVTRISNKVPVWQAVIAEAMEKSSSEVTEAMGIKFHEAKAALETAENDLMNLGPKVQEAMDRIDKILEQKKKDVAKEKTKQTKGFDKASDRTPNKPMTSKKKAAKAKGPAQKSKVSKKTK
jgi:hypothetical protein